MQKRPKWSQKQRGLSRYQTEVQEGMTIEAVGSGATLQDLQL